MFASITCKFARISTSIAQCARVAGFDCLLAVSSFALTSTATVNAQSQTEAPTAAEVQNQVNINTADAETLALALDGVGMAKAQDIIAHREQNGAFKTVDELQNVRGIGKATLERNRDRILIETADE